VGLPEVRLHGRLRLHLFRLKLSSGGRSLNRYNCHLCGMAGLSAIPTYSSLHRVTSDCKPWPPGGQLIVCPRCGAAQAPNSPSWEAEARQIYDAYTIYHQSGGAEQSVFDPATGAAASRSSRLLQRLNKELPFAPAGRLLDVGCGNGATLRALSEIVPGWALAGLEVNDHYKKIVESIPGVEALYVGGLAAVPGTFQAITLIHALEHIAAPVDFLSRVRDMLAPGGLLVVQVPDCWQNPFMFLVADHATHFFGTTLCATVAAAGYEILAHADDWVAKELTVVARKAVSARDSLPLVNPKDNSTAVSQRVDWLSATLAEARALAEPKPIALFGTSIAATWLTAELGERIAFYVDEDPHRAGENHLGRRIFAPENAPRDHAVLIALPPKMAEGVKRRLEELKNPLSFHVPPPLPGGSAGNEKTRPQ
jgi:2-polyprenyl-3-methyl-5-hydroxy-6-metoxy-1,4-benzoquinol methylase